MKKREKENNNDRVKGNIEFKKKSNDENENEIAKHVSNIDVMKH